MFGSDLKFFGIALKYRIIYHPSFSSPNFIIRPSVPTPHVGDESRRSMGEVSEIFSTNLIADGTILRPNVVRKQGLNDFTSPALGAMHSKRAV